MHTPPISLRGLSTVNLWAVDHAAARQWYANALGMEPYFERPGYFEFRLGDHQHELGVIDTAYAPAGAADGPGGAIAYWHVDDLPGTYDRLLGRGATVHEPITVRGEGFVTASVVDPFGNVLGVMTNVHYLQMVHAHQQGGAA